MTKTPAIRGLLAGFMLLGCSAIPALAQPAKATPKREPPTPAQMLDPRLGPKHDDVSVSTPVPAELANCTVVQVAGAAQGSSGWVLLNSQKQPLRRFFDSTGRGNVDSWSYYKDGVEVYREFDTANKGVPNNFRWLNGGGLKWGVGAVDAKTGKAVITGWRMISAEEVGFEAFQAVAQQDYARLQVLFASEADLQAMKTPAARAKAILAPQLQAQKKFADLVKTTNLSKVKFEDVDGGMPHCDTTGDGEIVKYWSRPVRYRISDKEHGWIHTGEIIQVGLAWKLLDVPSTTEPARDGNIVAPKQDPTDPELQKLLEALTKIDIDPPPSPPIGKKDAKVDVYLRQRISLVQKVVAVDKADQREGWYKQLFDNLMAMAQNNCDDATLALLKKMSDDVASQMPGSNLAAYGAHRLHWANYAVGTFRAEAVEPAKRNKAITDVQEKFIENLTDFVKKYPKADDTAEALYQVGNGCEFGGKIEEAKRWYTQLAESFPNHHLAPRAKGCALRLSLVGNRLELVAPLLNDANKTFDVNSLKGKVVIVHFWSSTSEQYDVDFRRLKLILSEVGAKQGVELVCISLDDSAAKAKEAVAKTSAVGTHLYVAPPNNAGGSNSPLAIQYGVHILPTVFVIGRDGRVTNNALQVGDLESELKKVQ